MEIKNGLEKSCRFKYNPQVINKKNNRERINPNRRWVNVRKINQMHQTNKAVDFTRTATNLHTFCHKKMQLNQNR